MMRESKLSPLGRPVGFADDCTVCLQNRLGLGADCAQLRHAHHNRLYRDHPPPAAA
jgi:hypothetical protein